MDITFESVAELVFRLGHPPSSKKYASNGRKLPIAADKIFLSWLNHLPRPFPPHTGKRLFRLLFPHDGARRRYGLKETRLSVELENALHIDGLRDWDRVGWDGEGGKGCLGDVLHGIMSERRSISTRSRMTITEVDTLLDELAAPSPYSQLSLLPTSPAPPPEIIRRLFRDSNLSPQAMAVLVQIILRDLRPLLNPLPRLRVRHPTTLLRVKTTEGPEALGLHMAMWCWDPVMARLYRDGKGSVDWCADTAEAIARRPGRVIPVAPGPIVGVNVPIPKCEKGRSIRSALQHFTAVETCLSIWAETKYDGYRMQIHVQVVRGEPSLTIFSKSKRNSTAERRNCHAAIYAALGLPIPRNCPVPSALRNRLRESRSPSAPITSSVILEAEVVPYNEDNREGGRGPGIKEFWWLQNAAVTADGMLPVSSSRRHLCVVFFDILHRDGESLIERSYVERRKIMQRTVREIEGFSLIAEAVEVSLSDGSRSAESALEATFQRSQARREEGLVLKASSSLYMDTKLRWVKLKKDYIPGLGDCVDLVVLGAGWDIDRARELRVDTSVFTTFYVGVMTNKDAVARHRAVPHFEVLFRVSYGLSRAQLEIYNDNLRLGTWLTKPYDKDDPVKRRLIGLSWTYYLPKSMVPPSVFLVQPLCAEIMGAGFQKLPFSNLFELRWPRLMKIFPKSERSWIEALTAQGLCDAAFRALGYAVSTTPASPQSSDDSMRALWRTRSVAVVDVPHITPSPKTSRGMHRHASEPAIKLSPVKLSPRTPRRGGDSQNGPQLLTPVRTSPAMAPGFQSPTPHRVARLLFTPERPRKRPSERESPARSVKRPRTAAGAVPPSPPRTSPPRLLFSAEKGKHAATSIAPRQLATPSSPNTSRLIFAPTRSLQRSPALAPTPLQRDRSRTASPPSPPRRVRESLPRVPSRQPSSHLAGAFVTSFPAPRLATPTPRELSHTRSEPRPLSFRSRVRVAKRKSMSAL